MSSRFRHGSASKTGFFAFQDIITSVTGVLILVTLILASHLEVNTSPMSQQAPDSQHRRLADLLAEQTRVELESHNLRDAVIASQAHPDVSKLQDDLASLKVRVLEEQKHLEALKQQTDRQRQAAQQRDATLGLISLRDEAVRTRADAARLGEQDRQARAEWDTLEQRLRQSEATLLKAKSLQGQMWLIPDDPATTKEPILAVVSREGMTLERFDKPAGRRVLNAASAEEMFGRVLAEANSNNQYVVFYVRPSGVSLFNRLSEFAKNARFEIGFDALEEATQIHFSKPPSLDDTPPPKTVPNQARNALGEASNAPSAPAASKPAPTKAPVPQPTVKKLNWWQRLLRAIGLY